MPLTRMTLEQRVQCVRLYSVYEKPSHVAIAWRKKFGTDAPTKKSIMAINKKFNETGSVADLSRSGRPKSSTSSKNSTLVQNAIRRDPAKTLRAIAQDLGINKTSVHRIKREAEKSGVLNQEENRKLKEQILALNKRIETLERKSSDVSSTVVNFNAYEGRAIDSDGQQQDNNLDVQIFPVEDITIPNSVNSNSTSMIFAPVSETQILHLDPEAFRILQAQCSKPDGDNSVTFY